jgi:hypothetical protein
VPVIGLARSPGRFSVVFGLAVAVLFALALAWLARRYPQQRRLMLLPCAALLLRFPPSKTSRIAYVATLTLV